MFGIGGFEFFIIILFAFLVFGPDKLPEIAGKVGRFAARFKAARDEIDPVLKADVQAVTNAAVNSTDMPEEPFKDSVDALERVVASVSGADEEKPCEAGTFAQRQAKARKVVRVASEENEEEVAPTEDAAPVEDVALAEDVATTEEVEPVEDAAPTEDAAPAVDVAVSDEEPAPESESEIETELELESEIESEPDPESVYELGSFAARRAARKAQKAGE